MNSYPELLESLMNAVITGDKSQVSGFIPDKKNFTPEEQLAVYVDGYRMRLRETMESAYPAVLHVLGEREFRRYTSRFIEATPSRHFNIDKYPIAFAEFLREHCKDIFIYDLANLESAIHAVYQELETPPLAKDWIEKQTPESLAGNTFLPRAASRLMAFSYPVNDYLKAFRSGGKPAKPTSEKTFLLVFRHRNQVQRLPLVEAEHMLFFILAEGQTLDAAFEDARFAPYLTSPSLPADMMQWFARWVSEGCLRQPDV